jgi:CubicO group peptidase (beta-lactamase class C family)
MLRAGRLGRRLLVGVLVLICPTAAPAQTTFPGDTWKHRRPAELGLDAALLDDLGKRLGGRGCVIKDGYVVASWGDQALVGDLFSSAKPVLSTLLFFALLEGLVRSVDQPIADFGWQLKPLHRGITFRHLGSMTSGYARPEGPGQAWAYNDYAIQLYQKTLFDKVFKGDPKQVAEHPRRLGGLGLQDGLVFRKSNRRISASVRDFGRIAWFWLNRGQWADKRLLPRKYFDDFMKPQAAADLPRTRQADTDDYLGLGTYGGGSDHFARCGPGVYGFNWWFNATGGPHPDCRTWPDAPPDTVMSLGARGNSAALIPSLNLVLVCANGDWDDLRGGDPTSKINRALALLARAAGYRPAKAGASPPSR